MRFLIEDFLLEDIWALKKYFPKIDDKKYLALIQLDPTYKGGDIAGTYAKWILSLANKDKLHNLGHVADILSRFDENKKNLKNKDIMTFKSLEDLDSYLNDKDSYKELSQRQELRQTQKAVHNTDLSQDAELVFENSKWVVYVPKTYEASCKLGQGTRWCTATTDSDYYYEHYTYEGPLYININKSTKEKFQFHFESGSFMDAEDDRIELRKFFSDNEELYAFYKPKVMESVSGLSKREDGTMVVNISMERLAKELSDRELSEEFLYACMTDSVYEIWEGGGISFDKETIEYAFENYIDDTNKNLLAEHNITSENFSEMIEEIDDLRYAFNRALNDAEEIGSQNAALTDFNDSLNNALRFDYRVAADDKSYDVYIDDGDILELLEYLGDNDNDAEETIIQIVSEDFRFYEPRYGWQGFDETVFNDCLYETLESEVF